jgi:hypothetical protein
MKGGDMDIAKLTAYCRRKLDFTDLQLDQTHFYQSLPLCVIDAVYSIGVRYSSTEATVRGGFTSPTGRGLRVRGF